MTPGRPLSPRAEDYLEAVYRLSLSKGGKPVRLRDIARALRVKLPSAVQMLRSLANKGLVVYERFGTIELTPKGLEAARSVYERHKTLYRFLREILGVDDDTAERDACGMEHHVSKDTLFRLLKFIEFIEGCPEGEPLWLSSFHYYLKHGERPAHCVERHLSSRGGSQVIRLSDLRVGESGKVVKLSGDSVVKRRLLDMGIVPGVEVRVERVAPLGDPIDVVVKGYHLSLRRGEAKAVAVVRIDASESGSSGD